MGNICSGTDVKADSTPAPTRVFSPYEVAKHNTRASCWAVYNGRVYDLTRFIDAHPGGEQAILGGAGADITDQFNAVHAYNASKMKKFCIGVLEGSQAAQGAAQEVPEAVVPYDGPQGVLQRQEWVGVRLVSRRTVAHNTDVFRLALPDPQARLGLPIGQHILLAVTAPNGKTVMKPYTPIADEPGFTELLIKVYRPTPNFPSGGAVSQAVFGLNLGDSVNIQGPKGSFMYRGKGQYTKGGQPGRADNMVFIAGGTGITPVYQVLRAVLSDPSDATRITLLYANHDEASTALKAELEGMACQFPARFKLVHLLSRVAAPAASSSPVVVIGGRLNRAQIEHHLAGAPAVTSLAGVCGPPGLISEVAVPGLQALGYTDRNIVVF